MSASILITYVWHYLVARVVYDEVLRPLIRGHPAGALVIGGALAAAFVVRWCKSRRRARRT